MQVNFSGPKKYIAPTESFEGDILKDVNDVEAEEAAGTGSDVVFVSNVDVVNNPYHFESVTQYVVIPKDEIEAKSAEGEVRVEKKVALHEEIATSEEVADDKKVEIEASQPSYTEEELTIVEGKEASSEEISASEEVDDVLTVEIEAKSVSQPSDQPVLVKLNSEDAVVETDGGAGFIGAKPNPALDVGFLESYKQKPKDKNTEKLLHLILGRNPKVTSEQADLYIEKLRASMNGKLTGLTVQDIVKGVEALMRKDGLARRKVVKETLDEIDPIDPPTSSSDKKKPEDTEMLLHQILARNPQLTSEQADLYIQKLRARRNGKLSGLSVQDIIKGVDALIREDGLARREVVEETLDEIGVFNSSKHGDDDTVLISTQDLTKLVKEVASASLQDPIDPMDCSQDDTILITTQDLDAILKEDMKLKEDEVEATGLSPVEEISTEATSGEKIATTGDVDDILGLVEGIKNVGKSINELPQAINDAGNNEILNVNRKPSEIVDVESDENEETPEDPLVEEVSRCVTDPNGSVESAGSLEVGMEAAEDAFVVIDEASDLLTDKTNIIIPKSLGDNEEKVEVISVVGDKENKTAGTKSSGKNKKGKNKKKVF